MADSKSTQIFIKLLDTKTLTLHIKAQIPNPIDSVKQQIQALTQIPTSFQTLIFNGKLLNPTATTAFLPNFATLTLTLPLHGGKGGFGSLLRGAATKAGQKKTNNFDACRDMSGRRLRHVNAEKKLEEWRAEEEERKLEKMADKYLKEIAKKKGQIGKREEKVEKYVEKYREESARCVEEVDRSVREAASGVVLGGRKRKVIEKLSDKSGGVVDAKKLKFWMGTRKMGESDSDDSDGDTESDESDTENEQSVIDNGSHSDSSKDGTTTGFVSVSEMDGDQIAKGSYNSGTEEERDSASLGDDNGQPNEGTPAKASPEIEERISEKQSISAAGIPAYAEIVSDTSTLREADVQLTATDTEEPSSPENTISGCSNALVVVQLLNFDDYKSASELEVLGLERLKCELQDRGLKCGGTLQERAARLYLLKTTPLDKLPKKLFAKK